MKVAVIQPYLRAREGASYLVARIAEHFNADVYCIEYNSKNSFDIFKKLKVMELGSIPLPRSRFFDGIRAGITFYFTKLPRKYDVIISVTSPSEWIRNRNSPVVWNCTSPNKEVFSHHHKRMKSKRMFSKLGFLFATSIFKQIENAIVPKIEYIIAISSITKYRIRYYLSRESEVIFPVFNKNRFRNLGYKNYFFYPSRIAPEKRFEYAIEAFRKFQQQGGERVKDWKLIIGGATETQYSEYITKIKAMAVNNVELLTDISNRDLAKLYGEAYTILFTPLEEDFGMVPIEGFTARKPCIAVNEGGPKETIIDGKDGYLVNSIEEMADRMIYLSKRPNRVKEMGKAGNDKLKGTFSEERFFSRISKVLDRVSKGDRL
jgi:glycosyltransferase involved in cell wall biosynthesis